MKVPALARERRPQGGFRAIRKLCRAGSRLVGSFASDSGPDDGKSVVMLQEGFFNRWLETAFEGMGRAVGSDLCQTCSDTMHAAQRSLWEDP
jgi:hypothetical protein